MARSRRRNADIGGWDLSPENAAGDDFDESTDDGGLISAAPTVELVDLYGNGGDGRPLDNLFTGIDGEAASEAVDAMNAALAAGDNPLSIVNTLAAILGVSQARAETIARTEMLGAWRDAQSINFRANSDVLDGWIWSADLAGACFPAGTLIRTRRGEVPIEQVRVGDEVLTHRGRYCRVSHTMQRRYEGEMVTLEAAGRSVTATSSHPFLIERQGQLDWVEAGHIRAGDNAVCERQRVTDIGNQCVAHAIVKRRIGQAHNGVAQALQKQRLASISGGNTRLRVPVDAIDLQDGAQFRQEEIDRIRPSDEMMLLQERDTQDFQALAGTSFRSRFALKATVAARGAKALICHSWDNAKLLAAGLTGKNAWGASAFLRAVGICGPGRTENTPAALAGQQRLWRSFGADWVAGKAIATPSGNVVLEQSPAFFAGNAVHLGGMSASAGAESLAGIANTNPKRRPAALTYQLHAGLCRLARAAVRMFPLMCGIAGGRAETPATSTNPGGRYIEGGVTSFTNTFHIHSITQLAHHIQELVVYNLEVECDHSYVANGFAVHNCIACVMMDGSVHPLDEDLSSHPNCECVALPLSKSWDDLLGDIEGLDLSGLEETDYLNQGFEDGQDWFLAQPESYQLETLGPAKFEAWQSGDVDLLDFVGQKDAGPWGNEIYERSLKEIGLDANAYLGRTTLADVTAGAAEEATAATGAASAAATTEAATEAITTFSTERIPADKLEQEMDRAVEAIHPSDALNAASEAKARVSADLAQRLEGNPEFDKVRAIYEAREQRQLTSEEVASNLLRSWASSGTDNAFPALQKAIRDEFGLTDAARMPNSTWVRESLAEWKDAQAGLRAFAREMYNNTQEWLEANGITEIPLYRGMGFEKLPKGFDRSLLDGAAHDISITMRAASSFSAVPGQALHFAEFPVSDAENNYYAQIIAARVPASLILATPQTGFGALDEYEVVVLGGQYDVAMIGVDNKAFYTAPFQDLMSGAVTKATVSYDQVFDLLAEEATSGE